jgi:hypothetical protein
MSEIINKLLGDDEPSELLSSLANSFGITDPEAVVDLGVKLTVILASVESAAYARCAERIGNDPTAQRFGAVSARDVGFDLLCWAGEVLEVGATAGKIDALGDFVEALKRGDVRL